MRRQQGLSLIEVVIGLACLSIVLVAVGGLLTAGMGTRLQAERRCLLQHSARHAVDSIARELQYASEIQQLEPERIMFTTQQFKPETISYWLDRSSSIAILRKDTQLVWHQPVSGDSERVKISIDVKFVCLRSNDSGRPLTVGIEVTATDVISTMSCTVISAVTGMNISN